MEPINDKPEFSFVHLPRGIVPIGCAIGLSRRNMQFTVSALELSAFESVIAGRTDEAGPFRLFPRAPEQTAEWNKDLRILNIGRFMIHFSDAELARFQLFIADRFAETPSLRNVTNTVTQPIARYEDECAEWISPEEARFHAATNGSPDINHVYQLRSAIEARN